MFVRTNLKCLSVNECVRLTVEIDHGLKQYIILARVY